MGAASGNVDGRMKSRSYDPVAERDRLESVTGFAMYQRDNAEDFARNRNLCSGAHTKLIVAVRGLLVGMDQPALEQARAARVWLERSIAQGEEGTFAGGRGGIRSDYAMSRWLLTGEDMPQLFDEAFRAHIDEIERNPPLLDLSVDIAAALALHAQQYDAALQFKDRYEARAGKKLKEGSRTPRAAGFAIAADLQAGNSADASKHAENLLEKSLNDWIGRGQYTTALSWLKIAHWNLAGKTRSPVDVVSQAHLYLKKQAPAGG